MMDKRDTQFLYRDGDDYIFMDQSTTTRCRCHPRASVKRPTFS